MGKIVVSEFLSLDGVMEDPAWSAPYVGEEQLTFKFNELLESDALLIGRVTYQEFSEAWMQMSDEAAGLPVGFSARMNSLPKFVASTSLNAPLIWNASLIEGDLAEEISALKRQFDQDILVVGSGELAHTLMQHNLVDEYRFLVYPVVVGSGKRLFQDGANLRLNLTDAKQFSTGIAVLTYQPA